MDFEKLTDRARGFLQAAQTIAVREHHQRIAPAHLLKALLDDPALGRAVGEQAQQYAARECSWPKAAAQYVEFLRQLSASDYRPRLARPPVPAANGTAAGAKKIAAAPAAESRPDVESYIFSFCRSSPLMEG